MKKILFLVACICAVLFSAGIALYITKVKGWDRPLSGERLFDRNAEQPNRPLRISEVRLERKGCLGTCPVYTITLRGDGSALYVGKRYVDKIGTYYGELWGYPRLASWIEMQHFEDLRAEYEKGVYDAEVVTTSVVIDGKRKTATTYSSGGGPLELWAINSAIDGAATNIHWQKQE